MIKVENLSKSYGHQVVLDDVSFLMTPGERLGLVGRNGHGKTTLFRILLGQEPADSGDIVLPRDYRIGHLSQHLHFECPTILDEVCSVLSERVDAERYRAEAALMGLGFTTEDFTRAPAEFSGGYQVRVNLAKVLVDEPNLLLLDEPTNHLDILSLRWLARFLRQWRSELILITHDRHFMNSVTTHTMAIHRRKLRRMEGPIEKLFEQIYTEEQVYEQTRLNEEKKRAQDERFIERFRYKATKAKAVQSRVKALDRRGRLDALENEQDLNFRFNAAPFHATVMMTVEGLSFGYPGGPRLVDDLSFVVEKGERVAIIGPNGKGKTTLLNLLASELEPDAGTIKTNPNTKIAYFGQTNIARLDPESTVEETFFDAMPDKSRTRARGLSGLLMFSGEGALKPVRVLSGGEKSRVLLGKLLVSPANLLLLDEPTNHLDLESIESLLDAVDTFEGSVLLVTHDEMILERVATRLVVFDGGRSFMFQGGYADFLERVGWQNETADQDGKATSRPNAREQRRQRAERVAERSRTLGPLKKRVEALEAEIIRLEEEVATLDAAMLRAAEEGRSSELADLASRAKRSREAIDERFVELEQASHELDEAALQFE
ncbi:MAG: ABC-F family ATP-binding cassette domain-containing protein [Planctomycetes bacterium]|nr:ABC-F family ATP-binding cassette domain-containing protein [Planctomycetota bacterium]